MLANMQPISGAGVIRTDDLPVQYVLPLPAGTTVSKRIPIWYTESNDTVTLEPLANLRSLAYGNFTLHVRVRVTDPTGRFFEKIHLHAEAG
jgi:hypothetical protein